MGLRERASASIKRVVTNRDHFGWDITVTDPAGTSAFLTGFSNDISQVIDPDTGQAVSGRLASVALSISELVDNNLGIPKAIADDTSKPWIVAFDDLRGNTFTFKVKESNPDRTVDLVVCILETYIP
jgi:hypothetical protein